MVDKVRVAIDQLTAELGEKKSGIWRATFSVKDVLEKADLPNNPGNQRYVVYTVRKWYGDSKVLPPQHDNGGFLEMKIRGV